MNPLGQPAPPTPPAPLLGRRRLLVAGAAAGAVAVTGGVALAASGASSPRAPSPRASGRGILVLVTCYGGNDGLNTVVPYADPAYAAARPDLGYTEAEVLPLGDGLGLNPKLVGLADCWKAGQLAVVRGVGYPDPSLSHFQSMDIWQTAQLGGVGPGWLGRWVDATGSDPLRAVSFGPTLPPALRGERSAATALTSDSIRLPGRPAMLAAFTACSQPGHDRPALGATVAASDAALLSVRSSLATLTGGSTPTSAGTTLADQMGDVVTLIKAGAPTQVYQVSLSSFDTHSDEKANHERLLTELDDAVKVLLDGVAGTPRASDVVLATVSEFGRRPAQNASGGTDHGTAAPVLVAGHGVRGGFVGDEPSLAPASLDSDANLRFTTDFRSLYATLLSDVVGVDPASVLGGRFPTLRLV